MIEVKSIRHFKEIRKNNLAVLESTTASVEEKVAAKKVLGELKLRFDSHGVPIPQPKEFDRSTPYPDEPEQTGGVDPVLEVLFGGKYKPGDVEWEEAMAQCKKGAAQYLEHHPHLKEPWMK